MELKKIFKKVNFQKKSKNENVLKPKHYYQDLINPYQILFNPSFMEINENILKETLVLNDMSWQKKMNYLNPIFRYPQKSTISLHFSPIDWLNILNKYKKELYKLKSNLEKEQENWKEPEKKMVQMIRNYEEMIEDLEEDRDSFLNYSILYSQDIEKSIEDKEKYQTFIENRTNLLRFFWKNIEQPSKYYIPYWQMEESFISQQPLCEYRIKDWSNIWAVSWMSLYPFFTETKDPWVEDWVPYWINRNTWELIFFNHSKLYKDWYITNKNLNIFWWTGSWKTSFMRSQIPLRMAYWDHFILFDPKKDYVAFTKDLWWQNISFKINEPMGYNLFYRTEKTYSKKEIIDGVEKFTELPIQTIEEKKQNLLKIFSIMCPYLDQKNVEDSSISEFSYSILDSALSRLYDDNPHWDWTSLQIFYDKYLKEAIEYFTKNEPEKMNWYTIAWERLKSNLWLFIIKEDWVKWVYHKMFLPVPKEKEIKLQDWPLINFDLSWLFRDDLLFTIGCLIWMEFTWTQIASKKWIDSSIYIWIDENWKLLKYDKAWEYEEQFSRLIRWLWGWLITLSQHLNEYINSEYWKQVLAQAQTTIILKIESNELVLLQNRFPKWFTEEVIKDFDEINQNKNSYWIWYISYRWRMQPIKYLYLPSRPWFDSWQEKSAWQLNMDSEEWFET